MHVQRFYLVLLRISFLVLFVDSLLLALITLVLKVVARVIVLADGGFEGLACRLVSEVENSGFRESVCSLQDVRKHRRMERERGRTQSPISLCSVS